MPSFQNQLAVCAMAVGALAAVGGSAQAGPAAGHRAAPLAGLQIVKAGGPARSQQIVAASCPAGKVAIGGGAGVGSAAERIVGSFPLMGPDGAAVGWGAIGRTAGTAGLVVNVEAVCADRPSGYTVIQNPPVSSAYNSPKPLACPGGTMAVGGGARVNSSTGVLTSSFPAPGGPSGAWMSGGHQEGGSSVPIASFAVCMTKQANAGSPAPVSASPRSGATIAASCPNGGIPVAGGGSIASGGILTRIGLVGNTLAQGWGITGTSNTSGTYSGTAFTSCLSPV